MAPPACTSRRRHRGGGDGDHQEAGEEAVGLAAGDQPAPRGREAELDRKVTPSAKPSTISATAAGWPSIMTSAIMTAVASTGGDQERPVEARQPRLPRPVSVAAMVISAIPALKSIA